MRDDSIKIHINEIFQDGTVVQQVTLPPHSSRVTSFILNLGYSLCFTPSRCEMFFGFSGFTPLPKAIPVGELAKIKCP